MIKSFRLTLAIVLLHIGCNTPDCQRQERDLYTIKGERLLTIEFNSSDTILFYKDTVAQQPAKRLVFVRKPAFADSYIVNLKQHLNSWLDPLALDRKLFMVHLEVLNAGKGWWQVCVSRSTGALLWVKNQQGFTVDSWRDFLLARDWVQPVDERCYPFFTQPDTQSHTVSSRKFGCMQVIGVDGNWLTIAYSPLACKYADSFDYLAYLRWRDDRGHLLLGF